MLAILVQLPWTRRPGAWLILAVLYRSPARDQKARGRPNTPAQLMRQRLKVMLHWCPRRQFVFAGDGGFGTHELAATAAKRPQRLTWVNRCDGVANVCQAAPVPRGQPSAGRPRKQGAKVPSPAQVVAQTQERQKLNPVRWV